MHVTLVSASIFLLLAKVPGLTDSEIFLRKEYRKYKQMPDTGTAKQIRAMSIEFVK